MMASEGKVRCQEGDTLGFTCSIHTTHNKLSLGGEEGEEDTGCHGEQVKVQLASRLGPARLIAKGCPRQVPRALLQF